MWQDYMEEEEYGKVTIKRGILHRNLRKIELITFCLNPALKGKQ
jgi:hypothetical protein